LSKQQQQFQDKMMKLMGRFGEKGSQNDIRLKTVLCALFVFLSLFFLKKKLKTISCSYSKTENYFLFKGQNSFFFSPGKFLISFYFLFIEALVSSLA